MKIKINKDGFAEQDAMGRVILVGEGEVIKVKKSVPTDFPVVLSNFSIEIVREDEKIS